jgi:hypothetical protein
VASRPSFWAGSLLSCAGLGMFWGATTQFTDWVLSQAVIIDMNILIIFIYVFLLNRLINTFSFYKIRLIRDNLKVMGGRFAILVKFYCAKLKWFE